MAAIGQILLKYGTGKEKIYGKPSVLRINLWVWSGLVCMVLSMLLNVRALSVVPLRDMAFILPTGYILVPLLAWIFLKEGIPRRTLLGTAIMILGMILFNLPFSQIF